MLRFFRGPRRQLIKAGPALGKNTAKYLLYAVGEILLVMIGILLALQVNNWNEERKERVKERNILIEISNDLEANLRSLRSTINFDIRTNTSRQIIIALFEQKMPFHDSLQAHLETIESDYFETSLSVSGYETLKNEGLDIIQSPSLRKSIARLFELHLPGLTQKENSTDNLAQDEVRKYLRQTTTTTEAGKMPIEYSSFLRDHYFLENLRAFYGEYKYLIWSRQRTYDRVDEVLGLIKAGLNLQDVNNEDD